LLQPGEGVDWKIYAADLEDVGCEVMEEIEVDQVREEL